MPAAIAVLPQPPLLVPELSGDAAVETEALREACRTVADGLARLASSWVAVGADPGGRRTVAPGTTGTFAGYGRDVPVALPGGSGAPADEGPELPLPLLIAAWAAAGAGAGAVRGELVAPDGAPAECLALGAALASDHGELPLVSDGGLSVVADGGLSVVSDGGLSVVSDGGLSVVSDDVGLLVVGDGAARHTDKAPGGFDERAEAFDAVVAAALDRADPEPLAGLGAEPAASLWAVGRAPWQVLAGAARGRGWTATHRHSSTPYGVAYHVALWEPA